MGHFSSILAGILLTGCVAAAFSPARADDGKLSEDSVRDFIEKTTSMTSGKQTDMSEQEVSDFLKDHIHPDARFKSTIRYNIPGMDIKQSAMSLGKDDFIKGVHAGEEKVSDYESQIEISDIKISDDGRSATVKTQTHESGKMPVSDEIEQKDVPMEGMSTCTQLITLSDKNVIQMYNATCVTDIQFDTFDPDAH